MRNLWIDQTARQSLIPTSLAFALVASSLATGGAFAANGTGATTAAAAMGALGMGIIGA